MSNETKKVDKGNILWRMSTKFQFAADTIIPDSFVFCVILAFIIFIVGMIVGHVGPMAMVISWYNGFWTQSTFAFQMVILVVTCASFAQAPVIKKSLDAISSIAKTPKGSMVVMMICGFIASFINWAFSTVVCPILAMRMCKKVKGLHFPMMIAAGYSTMILGQCMGPSASVYSLLAGEGHSLQDLIGVLPQSETTYNPMNVCLWFILAIVTVLLSVFTVPPESEIVEFHAAIADEDIVVDKSGTTPAEKMNNARILTLAVAIIGLVYIAYSFVTVGILKSLSLNFVIFIFITLNCLVYDSPKAFIAAIRGSMTLATDVMIQFPFYGAIMGMMQDSGTAQAIIDALSGVATTGTVPLITYISACIVNLFIPSQGGQWVVQGPIMVPLALEKAAYIPDVVNAFVYGDEATNMLQPLYLIPALAITNTPLKKVWGYCAYIFVFWFVITCIGLMILPGIF